MTGTRTLARLAGDPLWWVSLLFVFFVGFMPLLRPLFAAAFPAIAPPIYGGDAFLTLWLFHAALVAVSSFTATLIGVAGGVFATRQAGSAFRPMLEALATIGQTFPPVAVLAIAVPILMITEILIPARMIGAASGSSTWRKISLRVNPIVAAASLTAAGTLAIPAIVFLRIGRMP